MTLDQADIDRIADAVVERLRESDPPARNRSLTVAEVAAEYGVSPDTVYANAVRWGGVKMGVGPKARWRFDSERVEAALRGDQPLPGSLPRPRRQRPTGKPGVELLPIRGRG